MFILALIKMHLKITDFGVGGELRNIMETPSLVWLNERILLSMLAIQSPVKGQEIQNA